jgi:hypothetical protein
MWRRRWPISGEVLGARVAEVAKRWKKGQA